MRRFVLGLAGGACMALWGAGAATAGEDVAAIPFESVPGDTTLVGGPNPIVLDSNVQVTGTVTHKGVYKFDASPPTTYDVTVQRYVVETAPSDGNFGTVIPLDHALLELLCKDVDGCGVTLQMLSWINNDTTGEVASRTARLFLSQGDTAVWRYSDVGSSRVDLQACKLEYSIVSPK